MLSLRPKPIEQTHEEAFLERYQKLFGWLVQLTDGDRDLAKDLIQDAFVHFTFVRPELKNIRYLDGYLFELARNLHTSQMRRASNSRVQQLSILDYDSSEFGLRMIDVREQIQVQDELRRICHYACVRKETAWAGSVLILRFFYGYYATEIARILRNTRASVDVLLRCARHEAKSYLNDPHSLPFMIENSVAPHGAAGFARDASDFLGELRHVIFSSRQHECPGAEHLKDIYRPTSNETLTASELAHIVSCPNCLETVNRLLGLDSLAERHPVATIGREPKGKDKGGDEGGGGFSGGGSGAADKDFKSIKRHADETFDHKPNELYVAVNGYTLGSQKISSKQSELTLDVNVADPIDFIEVFSEQQVRLLFACVEDPPAGPIKQPVSVALSDGRRLEATLKFRSPWPTLHVSYSDPQFADVNEAFIAAYQQNPAAPLPVVQINPSPKVAAAMFWKMPQLALAAATESARNMFSSQFWLRPATVTVVFALLMASMAVWVSRRPTSPVLTAASLLEKSANAEEAIAAQKDIVLHRTINFEEKSATGALIARRKIEIWESSERGISARRLYDERGQLIAGDWRRSDGVQTLYHHGTQPKLQLTPEKRQSGLLTFENVWEMSPSAKEFSSLIGDAEGATVEERDTSFVITYQPASDSSGQRVSTGSDSDRVFSASRRDGMRVAQGFSPGSVSSNYSEPRRGDRDSGAASSLVKATLILSRSDLRAIEQTLLVKQGAELREYHFTEASFERHRPATVAPAVFEPDAELLSSSERETRNSKLETESSGFPIPASPAVATPALEIEVLRLLNQVGADTGEQVSVRRTPAGLLQIDAVVDSEARKREILQTLKPVLGNPSLRADVQTVAERVARESKSRPTSGSVTVERVEPSSNSMPLEPELRRYFTARGVAAGKIDAEVQRFSRQALNHSSQALQHAGALRNLAGRFSAEELRTLDPESRSRWLGLIRQHAQALRQNSASLRQELRGILAAPAADATEVLDISSDAELLQAVNRLFALCSANDATVRSALSLSTDTSKAAAVKGAQFWRSLANVEALATRISRR